MAGWNIEIILGGLAEAVRAQDPGRITAAGPSVWGVSSSPASCRREPLCFPAAARPSATWLRVSRLAGELGSRCGPALRQLR